MKYKLYQTALIALLFHSLAFSQVEYTKISAFYATQSFASVKSDTSFQLQANDATSFVLEFFDHNDVEKTHLRIGGNEIKIQLDNHSPNDRLFSQQFEVYRNQLLNLHLNSGTSKLTIHWYFVGHSKIDLNTQQASRSICNEPPNIDQSIWRNSPTTLPPPTVTPTETEVNHVIVHHSAGSNTNSNYQDVVRAIYIQHTQTNGWDDIGYNYLIAQDGTLFKGRDSQGNFDHDNVRGAHMCNKNNNTMAICLLGNYETTSPSENMLATLDALVAWKLEKENISAFGSSTHAIGPSSANLPDAELAHIAGHRDGCSPGYTVCPGQNVYEKLDSIRGNVDELMSGTCAVGILATKGAHELIQSITERSIQLSDDHYGKGLHIFNVVGSTCFETSNIESNSIDITSWPSGLYYVRYTTDENSLTMSRFFKP